MIFITIGSMYPFDRLIRLTDAWAHETGRDDVFAQIGGEGAFEPVHMKWTRSLSQSDFRKTVEDAELIVAHAGMGSVITAGQFAKPIVLLPRNMDLGEHNTDHQLATAAWLRDRDGIYVADQDEDLPIQIERALGESSEARACWPRTAPAPFIERLRNAILNG